MQFEVVTPKGSKIKAEVSQVNAPGTVGEMGILPGHRPLITSLGIGLLSYQTGGQTQWLVVNGGFLEVADEELVIITETAEAPEEIDVARAEASQKRAIERLDGLAENQIDARKFTLDAIKRAEIRIAASKLKKQSIPD